MSVVAGGAEIRYRFVAVVTVITVVAIGARVDELDGVSAFTEVVDVETG